MFKLKGKFNASLVTAICLIKIRKTFGILGKLIAILVKFIVIQGEILFPCFVGFPQSLEILETWKRHEIDDGNYQITG